MEECQRDANDRNDPQCRVVAHKQVIDTMLDLVTGGAGFIGSHLTDRLLALGRTVRVVDNIASGNPRNLEQHKSNPKLEVRVADVSDPVALADALQGVDRVLHRSAL